MQEYVSPIVCAEKSGSCPKPMAGAVTGSAGSVIPRVRGPDMKLRSS